LVALASKEQRSRGEEQRRGGEEEKENFLQEEQEEQGTMWARRLLATHDLKHIAPLFHLLHPHLPLHLPHLPHLHYSTSPSTLDPSPQFAYYEILQIPRHATQSQVKAAFYERSKVHHPDVAGEGEAARENFAAILVAYTCLRDHSARYHYDLHGFPLDKLLERRQEEESIYSWEPKYSVYSEPMTVDGETTELEDWFIAQGHVKKPSIWQRFSNGWVEFKFGMAYYNFPWEIRLLLLGILAWAVVALAIREAFLLAVSYSKDRKPIPLNDRWENDDQYDILWYAGVRRNKGDSSRLAFSTSSSGRAPLPSERERERAWRRRHHLPEPRPKARSQYSHTLYRSGGGG